MPPNVIRPIIRLPSHPQRATKARLSQNAPSRKHASHRSWSSSSKSALDEVHDAEPQRDPLDGYIENIVVRNLQCSRVSISDIHQQYRAREYTVVDRVIPYEERPKHEKRADAIITREGGRAGNGLVTVVHAIWNDESARLEKVAVCSGFVADASVNESGQGDAVVTCAHTLEQVGFFYLVTVWKDDANCWRRFMAVFERLTMEIRAGHCPSFSLRAVSRDQSHRFSHRYHATTCWFSKSSH